MNFKIKITLSLVVLFGLIGWIVFFNFKSSWIDKSYTADRVSNTAGINYPPNPIINFPEIESRQLLKSDFDNENLSLEMRPFIYPDAEEKTLSKIIYSGVDPKTILGFELAYVLISDKYNLSQFYQDRLDLAKFGSWQILAANLEDSRAFVEIEQKLGKNLYKVHLKIEEKGSRLEIKAQFLINIENV